jgi:hypothetical protein
MKLTIDNLNGLGETDYTALLDAEKLPVILRKLNEAPRLTAHLVCNGTTATAAAGSKVRLYRDSGDLWFSGYLEMAPQIDVAGVAMGTAVRRVKLQARGEMAALDRGVLSERVAMGGRTAGAAVAALSQEANTAVSVTGVQDVSQGSTCTVESGELWSVAAGGIGNGARAVLSAQGGALTMTPVGVVSRMLTDSDAGFSPEALQLSVGEVVANDITVFGEMEPAQYVCDCFTATGAEMSFYLTKDVFKAKNTVLVEDDFDATSLDTTKWVNDSATALTFATGGVTCSGATALRYRDPVEIGGLIILEQTGISYTSGQGIVGGLFCGGYSSGDCVAGVMLQDGAVLPVINGVVGSSVATLASGMLYEFRTLIFHPEPIRAGQVYSSSVCNGATARTAQVWPGTTRIVLTMRTINPSDSSTMSSSQVAIYDGMATGVQAYANYLPLWGANLSCTLGHAQVANHGAVWVQSAAPGAAWRTRVLGDVSAGAECYLSGKEIRFTAASEPVLNEMIEVIYRAPALACGRAIAPLSVAALKNTEDSGTRAMVAHVSAPAPRSSLDCEQAARALLDDLTQAGFTAEYQAWAGMLPGGASDVQPGEQWNITAAMWGVSSSAIVREVGITFEALSDEFARFAVKLANEAAKPIACQFSRSKHNSLVPVVSSNLQDSISSRPAGLPNARLTTWSASSMTLDAGSDPITGGGFEVRVEGDWGWGTTIDRNLVGRYTSRTITLANTGVTQSLYLRQYDASTPPQYSVYSTIVNLEV